VLASVFLPHIRLSLGPGCVVCPGADRLRPRWDVPPSADPVAERAGVGFAQSGVVLVAEEAGPGGKVSGDVRGGDPAFVCVPNLRVSILSD
jgi:hypothetical protein